MDTNTTEAPVVAEISSRFPDVDLADGEIYAGLESSAWFQYFNDGYQGYGHKDHHGRARAVRRVPV